MKIKRIYPMQPSEDGKFLGLKRYWLQEKYDGTRCILFKNNKIIMMGRSWKNDYSKNFPEIVKDAKKIRAKTCILDGELSFFERRPPHRNLFVTALATPETKKDYIVKLMVFDVLMVNGRSVENKPLKERLKILDEIIPKNLQHIKIIKTYKNPKLHKKLFYRFTSAPHEGEGVVLKDYNSPYREGVRTYEWIKVKRELTADCIVVGITKGTGYRENYFGSLILGQYDNGKLKYVGKCSGFTDEEMKMLYKKIISMPSYHNPFDVKVDNVKKWVEPKIVVEVRYMERTKYGVLRFPAFIRIRYDKTPKECIFGIT